MRLFVFGYFGCGNLGDEAILTSFRTWAESCIPGCVIVAQSANPDSTRRNHGVEAVAKMDIAGLIREIRHCDAVVAPGGGLLQDSTSIKSLIYYLLLMRTAFFFRKPVFMLSQGMGPLYTATAKSAAAKVLKKCAHVAVRDDDSFALLKELGLRGGRIEQTGDIVLLSEPSATSPVSGREDRERIVVGISLRPSPELDHIKWVVIGCLLRLNERKPIELRLFALNKQDDHPIMVRFLRDLRQRCPNIPAKIVEGEEGVTLVMREMESEVAGLDVMVGMRLHSLVFAARAGVPFVGLSYDPKVASFAKGCGQHVVENLADAEPLDVMHGMELALNDRARGVEAIKCGLKKMRGTLLESMVRFCDSLRSQDAKGRKLLSVPVSTLGFDETMKFIYRAIEEKRKSQIVTLNPEMLLCARSDGKFSELLGGSSLNTADGIGIRIGVLLKYGMKIEKSPGVEIVARLLDESKERGIRIFLLGSKPEVIEAAARNAASLPSKPEIVGYHHGYLKDVSPGELAANINRSGADVVLAGMGSPAQECWIRENMGALNASVFIGVGGTFDVLAGAMTRAPELMQKLGLEWLYRLVRQPSRAGRIAKIPWCIFLCAIEAVLYRLHITSDY